MRYFLQDVDNVRSDGVLLRALRAIRDAVNDQAGSRVAGTGTLVAGLVKVTVPGLQAGTVVVVSYGKEAGTAGRLRCDPAEHDLAAETATIRSSSSSDTSTVSWIAER